MHTVSSVLAAVILAVGLITTALRIARSINHHRPIDASVLSPMLACGIASVGVVVMPGIARGLIENLEDLGEEASESDADSAAEATSTPEDEPPPPAEAETKTHADPPGSDGEPIQIDWALIGAVTGSVLAALALGAAGLYAASALSKRRHERRELTDIWQRSHETLSKINREYGDYQADLADVLFDRPALDDVHEPDTAAFIEDYATARRLLPDDAAPLRHREHLLEAAAAVDTAATSWRRAVANAVRLARVSDATDRARLRRARSLLDQALDPSTSQAHRDNIVVKITDILADLPQRHVPDVATKVHARAEEIAALGAAAGGGAIALPAPTEPQVHA